MKKILMGLMAVSAISYSAVVDPSTTPAEDNTSIFQTGQVGKINIEARITSEIPDVKYAVFTSADGTLNGATDTLVLPTVLLTTEEATNVMQGTPNKIYVKRVDGDNQLTDLTVDDEVEFLATGLDPFYTAHLSDVIPVGDASFSWPFTSFITKTELERIASLAYPDKSPSVNTYGEIEAIFDGKRQVLRFPNRFVLHHIERGVGEFKIGVDLGYKNPTNDDTMTVDQMKPFLQQAATPLTGTVYFQVRIK